MSEDSLLTALLEVQRDAKTLTKDKPGVHGKYVPLDSIVEAVRDSLASNGLVWVTMPVSDDHGHPALLYRLAHAKTGEVLEGVMPLLLDKQNAQGLGSAITYARRYSLCAVLNLVADEDDDGQKASQQQARAPGSKASEPQKKKIKAQITTLKREGMTDSTLRAVLDDLGFNAPIKTGWVDQLTSKQASGLITALHAGRLPDPEAGSDIPSDLPWDGEVEPVA